MKKFVFEGNVWSPPTKAQIYEAIGQGLYYQGQHRSDINELANDIAYEITSFEGLSENWDSPDPDVPAWYDCMDIRDDSIYWTSLSTVETKLDSPVRLKVDYLLISIMAKELK